MTSFDYNTVQELQKLCRDRGYKTSGTKDVLTYRLRNNGRDPPQTRGPTYENRTGADLEDLLYARGLPTSGTKAEKIARLRR